MVPTEPLVPPSTGLVHAGQLAGREGLLQCEAAPTGCVRACVSPTHTHTHTRSSSVYAISQKSTFPLSNEKTDVVCLVGFRGWSAHPFPRRQTRRPLLLRGHAAVSRAAPHPAHNHHKVTGLRGPTPTHQPRPDSAPPLLAGTEVAQTERAARAELRLLPTRPGLKSTSKTGRVTANASKDARLASPASSSRHVDSGLPAAAPAHGSVATPDVWAARSRRKTLQRLPLHL